MEEVTTMLVFVARGKFGAERTSTRQLRVIERLDNTIFPRRLL